MNVGMTIVANDMCIGCGICVPICPIDNLNMDWNYGKFEAKHKVENCLSKCDLCFQSCPFDNKSLNEDIISKRLFASNHNIQFNKECGYYLKSYLGYTPNKKQRLKSASGGITSYLLELLLMNKKVDAIAVVSKTKNSDILFRYKICTTIEEINQCSGSAYYPVEASEILKYILENDGKYAIVALPCVSTAIRNAMKINKVLKKRIIYIIGLVCGQTKTHYFADYLAQKESSSPISSINFRTKSKKYPVRNYGCKITNKNNEEKIINVANFSKEWSDRYFTPNACNFCDDIFAETSDIAIMDAWIPKYSESTKGYNLILNRNTELEPLIENIENIETIDINSILKSQDLVIVSKREDITERIRVALSQNEYVPQKREHLLKDVKFERKFVISFSYLISKRTQKFWKNTNGNYNEFMRLMKSTKNELFIRRQIYRFFTILKRLKVIK
jgi:coenzyme F420-reducing hydrogenase beta subunit